MRTIHEILAAISIAAFLFGCDGPTDPDPPPPEGTYKGVYIYEKAGQPVLEQHVTWIFTPNTVLMDLDTTMQTDRVFCDIEGRYVIEQGIDIFISLVPGRDSSYFQNRHQDECNPDLGPFGKFQIDQSVKMSIIMTRNRVEDTAFQRIIIDKISDEY